MINLRSQCCHHTSKHVATELSNMFPHREFTSEIFGPVLRANEVLYDSKDILSISKGVGFAVEALAFTKALLFDLGGPRCHAYFGDHLRIFACRRRAAFHHEGKIELGLERI